MPYPFNKNKKLIRMRVHKPFLIILALCITVSSFAQKGSSFIEVDGGVSLPLGNWGKTSTATSLMSINGTVNDKSGYAKTGGFFSVDGAWFFSKHFGVGGMFKYGTYSLKGVDSLSQGYEESFDVDQTATTVTNYKMWSILPGIYYDWHFAKKFGLTARALAGIAHSTTPAINVAIEDGGVPDPAVVQASAAKTSFATDLGLGLQYNIIKCIAIRLRADYFYTKPDFTIDNSGRNNNAGREVNNYNEPLESVNFSLGVAYTFGHK
jgi:Outer membrane protein beta-barrel domain